MDINPVTITIEYEALPTRNSLVFVDKHPAAGPLHIGCQRTVPNRELKIFRSEWLC